MPGFGTYIEYDYIAVDFMKVLWSFMV